MLRRSAHRLTTTFFVVLSLVFSQLALASYACPSEAAQENPAPMEMAPGEPCAGMAMPASKAQDQKQPQLCHQHCADAAQSFDPVQAPTVSLPAVVQALVVPLPMDAGATESVDFAQAQSERPPQRPLFLSTLRLRV